LLGELYRPKGPALETAQQVLEIERPFAVNIAYGCPNGCYDNRCYNYRRMKGKVRFPKDSPASLVEGQLAAGLKPEGAIASFHTDPFLEENARRTETLIELLLSRNIRVATLSKLDISHHPVRHGMTIVSPDPGFSFRYEPHTLHPQTRVWTLKEAHDDGEYTWISMEPYPPPIIWKQDLHPLLEAVSFVDFIIFGKLNYDYRASTLEAREFYRSTVAEFTDFCKAHGIRYWIKSDTRKFIERKD